MLYIDILKHFNVLQIISDVLKISIGPENCPTINIFSVSSTCEEKNSMI